MNYSPPYIHVMYWNANSILNHIYELYDTMNIFGVHVCCVSETCLEDDDIVPSHRDFHFYRLSRQSDHRRASGGVGIISAGHSAIHYSVLLIRDCLRALA